MICISYNQVRRIFNYVCRQFFNGNVKETIYWLKSEVGVPDTVDYLADAKNLKYIHPHDVDTIGYGLIHELWDKCCDCDYDKLRTLLNSLEIFDPRIINNFTCYSPSSATKKNTVETLALINKCNKGALPRYTIASVLKAKNLIRLSDGRQVPYNAVIDAVLESQVYISNFSALLL